MNLINQNTEMVYQRKNKMVKSTKEKVCVDKSQISSRKNSWKWRSSCEDTPVSEKQNEKVKALEKLSPVKLKVVEGRLMFDKTRESKTKSQPETGCAGSSKMNLNGKNSNGNSTIPKRTQDL